MVIRLPDNPVITKELRGRMRGPRAYWILLAFLTLLSLTLIITLTTVNRAGFAAGAQSFLLGREFFKVLFCVQAILIALITPALTAGSLSLEREQRTFELLRATTLSPRSIVLGKLLTSLSFVGLLLTASLPLVSVCFLLGGVSPFEVFFTYALLLCDAALFGAIGLAWSAYAASTAIATVFTYITILAFFIGTVGPAGMAYSSGGFATNLDFSAVNPIGAIAGPVTIENYYHFACPAWIPAILINGGLALILLMAAANRMSDFPTRALGLRVGSALYVLILLVLLEGALMHSGTQLTSMVVYVAIGLLLLVAPIFVTGTLLATGEGDPSYPDPGGLAAVKRAFAHGTLATGLPYMLALTAVVIALTDIAWHWFAKVGNSPVTFPKMVPWSAVAVAAVYCLAGIGRFFSIATRNRWLSMIGLYVFAIISMVAPTFLAMSADRGMRDPNANWIMLSPFYAGAEFVTDSFEDIRQLKHSSIVGSVPLVLVTVPLYLVIGGLGFGLSAALRRKQEQSTTVPVS